MSKPLDYTSANSLVSEALSSVSGDSGARALFAEYERASEADRAVLFMVAIYRLAGTELMLSQRSAA